MSITTWDQTVRFEAQSQMVSDTLASTGQALDQLLQLMRQSGEAALYLCGSRVDHAHCLGSEDLGLLLSVLPQDAVKAAVPGFHPGSTEVYVTFQGTLAMECLENQRVVEKSIAQHGVLVLPPGQCHRVRYDRERASASLIVKTNLRQKPGVVRCDECTYYPQNSDCPLYRSWNEEEMRKTRAEPPNPPARPT